MTTLQAYRKLLFSLRGRCFVVLFLTVFLFFQMLCEERGLFLEIADIIRGLGLTILKGVMETCNDKIWAHFAVEVIVMKSIN